MVETVQLDNDIVVFLVGTTGVGKSKLALDLASDETLWGDDKRGEIINADSMQVYSGNLLGAMTARPTPADEAAVPHHCYASIDMLSDRDSQTFNVQKYREMALSAITDVRGRGNIPIVCGGTNYYIEALLFNEGHQDEACDQIFDEERFKVGFDLQCVQNRLLEESDCLDLLAAFRKNIPIDNK